MICTQDLLPLAQCSGITPGGAPDGAQSLALNCGIELWMAFYEASTVAPVLSLLYLLTGVSSPEIWIVSWRKLGRSDRRMLGPEVGWQEQPLNLLGLTQQVLDSAESQR